MSGLNLVLPDIQIERGRYRVRFAQTAKELDAVLRLRFDVFNVELGEGLESSYAENKDYDCYDDICWHLIVEDRKGHGVVGTYRAQTYEMAKQGYGFYSAQEFDFSKAPVSVIESSIEIGRACIARDHRNSHVFYLLWTAIYELMRLAGASFVFGCCSLTSQDVNDGAKAFAYLRNKHYLSEAFLLEPVANYFCLPKQDLLACAVGVEQLPKLFRTYLMYGALVCSYPALDKAFKTIDFLTICSFQEIERFVKFPLLARRRLR